MPSTSSTTTSGRRATTCRGSGVSVHRPQYLGRLGQPRRPVLRRGARVRHRQRVALDEEFHVDALRLDAVHALVDHRAVHLLEELAARTDTLAQRLGRPLSLIAESDLNDPRLISPRELGGYGLTAQWNDDMHHAYVNQPLKMEILSVALFFIGLLENKADRYFMTSGAGELFYSLEKIAFSNWKANKN